VLVLDSHNTTTPGLAELFVVVVLDLEGLAESLEVLEVFLVDLGEAEAGSCLHVDELAEVGLSTDEAVWDTLLSAESGEEDNGLNRVDVVGDHNKSGLLLLNELGHMVETELDEKRLVASCLSAGGLLETLLLFLAGLRRVFGEQLKKFAGLILLNGVRELSNCWWDLESLHEDSLLALNTDVLGPFDESREVSLGLDVATDSEVT